MSTAEMIRTHPDPPPVDAALLARAVDALLACAQVCTSCADACLGEEHVADLRSCIRTDLACADVCTATARLLARHATATEVVRAQLEACVVACRTCGDECAGHAEHHEHCRVCAEACRACEQACREVLAALG